MPSISLIEHINNINAPPQKAAYSSGLGSLFSTIGTASNRDLAADEFGAAQAFAVMTGVQRGVAFWQKQKGKILPAAQVDLTPADSEDEEDVLLQDAQSLAIKHNRISASLLQRKLGIGYAKTSSLLDHLEDKGIVGPGDPGKSREVIKPG